MKDAAFGSAYDLGYTSEPKEAWAVENAVAFPGGCGPLIQTGVSVVTTL